MIQRLLVMLCSLGIGLLAQAQTETAGTSPQLQHQQERDISYLAADMMEGRETGEPGEVLSAGYIAGRFHQLGLLPAGENNSYFQEFPFITKGKYVGKNFLSISGEREELKEDWYPMSQSGSGRANGGVVNLGYGIHAPQLGHDDYANIDNRVINGKVVVMELGLPGGTHPHSKFLAVGDLNDRIDYVKRLGASAIVFANSDPNQENPSSELPRQAHTVSIPVVFVQGELAKKLTTQKEVEIKLAVNIVREKKSGRNVIAKLDFGAPTTVIIGAHYDHLGYGDHGSLHRGEKAIHNGADDNASGVAMILSLAEYFATGNTKGHNLVFIAFTGEEMGLLGSGHFVKSPTIDLSKVSYMINLDMVGRLKAEEKTLGVNGVGTSPSWNKALKKVSAFGMDIKTTESGIGPSDHTSFYLKNIPVIHVFSGTHNDYHKPSDDVELINYDGMGRITHFLEALIEKLDKEKQLEFTATKSEKSGKAPKFSVTLGVVPDYLFDGNGMRIDGVSEGKPAAKAGIKSGDVVVQMGSVKVVDMRSYMNGLGQFKKGDTATVTVDRDGEQMDIEVQF